MITGKPGISSFDMFATGHAIRSELRTMGGNLLGLNSTIMKLSNGDDDSSTSLDSQIGAREVRKVTSRQIGRTVSSTSGGVGPTSTPARTANLLGNPYMRRYEGPDANGSYNFGLQGSPAIGEYYDVYESEENHLRFLDDTVGKDLFGYTHLENAAIERSGDASNDEIYLKTTYSIFGDINYPFDSQDIEAFKLGPKRYNPSEPYILKPLENEFVRRTINGDVQGFKEKFEAFTPQREPYRGSLLDMWDYMGSHYYLNLLNGVAEHGLYVENYEFEPRNRVMVFDRDAVPQSDYAYFLDVDTVSPDKEIKGLLGKTNRMFYEGKIKSLVNRFATLNGNNEGRPDFLNTATDHVYGLSRGRNLRKLNLTNENGYPNPYCRVWTTHYQYSKYKHLIRGKWADDSKNAEVEHYTLHNGDQLMRPNKGYERLKNFTSLDPENGRPIFTPYYINDRNKMEDDSIKRCMFSIENLAWKDIIPDSTLIRKGKDDVVSSILNADYEVGDADINFSDDLLSTTSTTYTKIATKRTAKGYGMTLTPEQRGPNGGRIMWFPPYNLKFSEQTHADWNANDFIGRGEKVYSYVNSERTGTLSFTLLVDHPSIINEWTRGGKMGKTANKTSPLSKDEVILRYFAGCDALEFNPRQEYDVPYTSITETKIIDTQKEETVESGTENVSGAIKKEENWKEGAAMTFYSVFYYPNNYSAADFMGQKVSKANNRGTLEDKLPRDEQEHLKDYALGLDEMFEKGDRYATSNKGYERHGNATGDTEHTGMTYNGKYYDSAPGKYDASTRYWYYPVDSRVHNEILQTSGGYKDLVDYGLNADFYGTYWGDDIPEQDKIVDYLNNGNTSLSVNTWQDKLNIAKSTVNLSSAEEKYFIPAYNFYKHLNDVISKFNAATNNKARYEIEVQGFASSHGYSSKDKTFKLADVDVTGEGGDIEVQNETRSNDILAENRAAVIEGWIRTLPCFDFNGRDTITHNGNGEVQGTSVGDESGFRPKVARAAVVTFKIIPAEKDITEIQQYDEVSGIEKKVVTGRSEETRIKETYITSKSDDYENDTYDNEYTYFKRINENDDMVKRYISDKVDYFDPAFHSITPEGFNARLTFLQQCVRQGPTISSSDLGMGSAYGAGNLSFGRAPFCVLRIGDFFNTKICIHSINIEYDNNGSVQWDLNPEGVGLQPMMANVNITFTFLGGSDISGPIARLQNAASFNYYANTSIYDRRSDYRESYVTPKNDESMTWSPLIRNKDEGPNVIESKRFWTRKPNSETD